MSNYQNCEVCISMSNYQNCEVCGYAMETECGNPACLGNPSLSPERKSALIAYSEKLAAEYAERAMLRRARRQL